MAKKTKRQQAILKRNLFLGAVAAVLIAAIALTVFIITSITGGDNNDSNSQDSSNISQVDSENQSSETSSKDEKAPEYVTFGDFTADKNYERLILVNIKNPLPEDYDYTGNLMTFPESYKWGSKEYLQIDKDMWPYLKAMMNAARADGIEIGITSPFRDYNTQKNLFNNKVQSLMQSGLSKEAAEKETATKIAVPGTSEHHTGLAVDFNGTSTSFENTAAFSWLKKNAENYGFIMRYAKDKMDITGGIIYEPWHWRFVGINAAKEINQKGYCLEEYLENR